MKYKRVEPGFYKTEGDVIQITRLISRQTYRADEVIWCASIYGHELSRDFDTLREAKQASEQVLMEERNEKQHESFRVRPLSRQV